MGESDTAVRTRARVAIYHVLSSAFYPPRPDAAVIWATMHNALDLGDVEAAGPRLDKDQLEIEYNRLFVGPSRVPCPPYESVHRSDRPDMERGLVLGPSVADVKKMYAEAGLAVSADFKDLPDHIAVELEFMYYLCSKELETRTDSPQGMWRDTQRRFFESHLEPWADVFAAKILASTQSPYYRLAANLLRELLQDERAYLDVAGANGG
jgi:TorA maturation chaperone TorD